MTHHDYDVTYSEHAEFKINDAQLPTQYLKVNHDKPRW